MSFVNVKNYRHGQARYDGILLVNLGTPSQPTASAIRNWLNEFLSDPRVVEIPRPVWWLILKLFILPLRPYRLAKLYQSIWTEPGSPLLVYSQRQWQGLKQRFNEHPKLIIELAMSYGQPSIRGALQKLQSYPIQRLLVLPLYPQYSATTSAAVFDELTRELQTWRWLPELRFINSYYDDAKYIQACAQQIADHRQARDPKTSRLLLSFHGLPKANLMHGDPYHCQCQATAKQIATALDLNDKDWQISFQSRFGRAEWLKPYTSEMLDKMAQQGIQHVDVFCPGFSADCLETLEEIKLQNRDVFIQAGGLSYHYIPALNDQAEHLDCLQGLLGKHSRGWEGFGQGGGLTEAQQQAIKERALRLGAKQ